jgi:YVTN family beta-propeller protein
MGTRSRAVAHVPRALVPALALAIALVLATAPLAASAATVSSAWKAKVGSGGANGTATIQGYTTGSGAIVLKLAKLRAATLLPVTLHKGTCASVGAVLMRLPAIKTTSTGAAARTTALLATQVRAITVATSGTGKIAIRVGSGTAAKCGAFVAQAIAPVVAAKITVGRSPSGVAIAPSGAWVTNWYDNTLSRIDVLTNKVLQTVPLTIAGTGGPEAIAYGEGSLWVTVIDVDSAGGLLAASLLRVNPATGQQVASIPIGRGAWDVEASPGAVWVPLSSDNQVVRIDPTTNAVVATIPVAGGPTGAAIGLGSLWVSTADGHLARIDPATNQVVATIATQTSGGFVAVGGGAVWMTNPGLSCPSDGLVSRVDPTTNQVVASVAVGSCPEEIAYGGGSLWVGLFEVPTVVRVSATTNAVLGRVTVSHPVYGIAASDHAVWVVHNVAAADDVSEPPPGVVTRIAY